MKYYAVQKGKTPGVYTSWDECKAQVEGVPGAVYKSFKTLGEAEDFLGKDGYEPNDKKQAEKEAASSFSLDGYYGPVAFVDGSFNAETDTAGYGAVVIMNPRHPEEQIHLSGKCDANDLSSRNIVGEVYGAIAAIQYCLEHGKVALTVFHDYEGVGKWATGEWKAKSNIAKVYEEYCESLVGKIDLRFEHVKGHSGIRFNELADILARMGSGVTTTMNEKASVHPEPSLAQLAEYERRISEGKSAFVIGEIGEER